MTPPPKNQPILSAQHLFKFFVSPEGRPFTVLEDINLELHEGEIVALLGRSGSGKSTLLRSLLGLIPPSSGEVRYRGQPVTGPMPGMALVFQSFALFPWLTVQQNVELGLEAMGIPTAERRRRALDAIKLIGLDGFESAFPKELSGGMRQRVGFARALVTNPDVLFMDEPFSALDVLTSETLRSELLDLWNEQRIPTKSILIVTHNIEEAALMADRILILSANPGRMRSEIQVPHPRLGDRNHPAFKELVEQIYRIMTTPASGAAVPAAPAEPRSLGYRLPAASAEALVALLERVEEGPDYGREDLPRLADEMQLEVDDLFPLVDAAALLGLAEVKEGDIQLTPQGHLFVEQDGDARKKIFAARLREQIPLIAHILRVLETRLGRRAPENRFLQELEDYMSTEDAEAVLATAIDWGRYAELFEYDYNAGVLSMEEPLQISR
ncbi:MAG TPA: nitrate/sulfonate/bicarbonate ABC transporter ATP-binding protein [Meiothermus sp.]|nr:nitrate/sulfonate/bicarbonate ABC transporter ATP-binding protein [Meiothermus sp.]